MSELIQMSDDGEDHFTRPATWQIARAEINGFYISHAVGG